jgi:hypothetical protein
VGERHEREDRPAGRHGLAIVSPPGAPGPDPRIGVLIVVSPLFHLGAAEFKRVTK